jgi:hypothetical protein
VKINVYAVIGSVHIEGFLNVKLDSLH